MTRKQKTFIISYDRYQSFDPHHRSWIVLRTDTVDSTIKSIWWLHVIYWWKSDKGEDFQRCYLPYFLWLDVTGKKLKKKKNVLSIWRRGERGQGLSDTQSYPTRTSKYPFTSITTSLWGYYTSINRSMLESSALQKLCS